MVYGFGRTEKGIVADFMSNRWGRTAVIHLEDGSEEYVSDVVESGIGCHVI